MRFREYFWIGSRSSEITFYGKRVRAVLQIRFAITLPGVLCQLKCGLRLGCWALKKTTKRSVKKQKLFDRREFFCFSGVQWFFSPTNTAAAFLLTFFAEEKSKSPSGLRTLKNTLPFFCLVLVRSLSIVALFKFSPFLLIFHAFVLTQKHTKVKALYKF